MLLTRVVTIRSAILESRCDTNQDTEICKMGQAMMHSPADDPLLFCKAVPWSHLFDLDSRHPTCYTVKKLSVFYCIWTLDYGVAVELESGPWTVVLDDTGCLFRHPNKKCNNVARSWPGSNRYVIIVPPPNSTTWTGRVMLAGPHCIRQLD